jgi:hypothetical protein
MASVKKKGQSTSKAAAKSSNKVEGKAAKRLTDKQSKSVAKKVGKSIASKSSSESAKKFSSKITAKNAMAGFTDARISDVSDKVFVASSPVHGKGLFAAKRIKANTVLGRLHGMPTFDDGIYVLWITDDLGLELTNDFKFINHNSNPNAAYSDLDVMVLHDVEPGEELLHDYGW